MKKPFFARFLEKQDTNATEAGPKVKTDVKAGWIFRTYKYPSDLDEKPTLKYPSDGDETGVEV